MINIRLHHGFCFNPENFIGQGYSEKHSTWLQKNFYRLYENPDTLVKIEYGEDTFCKKCPHSKKQKGTCHKDYVTLLDKKINTYLDLKNGQVFSFRKFLVIIKSFISPETRLAICSDCGWRKKGVCKTFLERGF